MKQNFDGVVAIIEVGFNENPLHKKVIFVQDKNDRGRNDGLLLSGLPAGGLEDGESIFQGVKREVFEETGISSLVFLYHFGVFSKLRSFGINQNNVFVGRISDKNSENLQTQDKDEVKKVFVMSIEEVLSLGIKKFHEGTLRILLNYLNDTKDGSLNKVTRFNNFVI